MSMVVDIADQECFHAVVAGDAAHVGPKAYLQVGCNEGTAFLGAEDAMKQTACEGMCHEVDPPVQPSLTGLKRVNLGADPAKVLGYFQLSLPGHKVTSR